MAKKKRPVQKSESVMPAALSPTESHLMRLIEHGYQLETSSLEGGLLLRDRRTREVLRPTSANLSTVKALQERDLISPIKSRDPLVTVWRINKKAAK